MAEVYRDMEWTMQQQGFDYACDKRLYDRLRRCATTPCATATGSCSKCAPAWEGNWTWDCFLVFSWQGAGDEGLVVTVNYAPNQSQCYVRLPCRHSAAHSGGCRICWLMRKTIGTATISRARTVIGRAALASACFLVGEANMI
jgi:hypothetical protein